jgi:hypothetical protein
VVELIALEEIDVEDGVRALVDKGFDEDYARDQLARAGFGEFDG